MPRNTDRKVEPKPMITEFMNRSPKRDGPAIASPLSCTISSYQVSGGLVSKYSADCRIWVVKRFT